jgi:hypothetical protein
MIQKVILAATGFIFGVTLLVKDSFTPQVIGVFLIGLSALLLTKAFFSGPPRNLLMIAIPLIAALLLTACESDSSQFNSTPVFLGMYNGRSVIVHDGDPNVHDSCVFKATLAGTAVAAAATATGPGAIVGWTIAGLETGATLTDCLGSWRTYVKGNLEARGIVINCVARYGWNVPDSCLVGGWTVAMVVAIAGWAFVAN